MYIEQVGKEMDDDVFWDLMKTISDAVIERGCKPASEEVLVAWVENVVRMIQDKQVTNSFIVSQVNLYKQGFSGVEIADFMTILPCSKY